MGYKIKAGDEIIKIDAKYFRPTEVGYLLADISKAKKQLDWTPKVNFKELVMIMADYDMKHFGLRTPGKGIEAIAKKGFEWTKHEYVNIERIENEI